MIVDSGKETVGVLMVLVGLWGAVVDFRLLLP